jgi:hypothetical protein
MKWKPLTVNKLIACMDKGTTCFVCKGDREEYDYFKIIRVSKYRDGNCFVHRLFLNGNINRFPSHLVGTCKSQAYALRRMCNRFKVVKRPLHISTEVHGDTDKCLPVSTSLICGNIDGLHIDNKSLGPRTDSEIQECIDKSTLLYTFTHCEYEVCIKTGYINSKIEYNDFIEESIYRSQNDSLYTFYVDDNKSVLFCSKESLFYTKQAAFKELEKVLK